MAKSAKEGVEGGKGGMGPFCDLMKKLVPTQPSATSCHDNALGISCPELNS